MVFYFSTMAPVDRGNIVETESVKIKLHLGNQTHEPEDRRRGTAHTDRVTCTGQLRLFLSSEPRVPGDGRGQKELPPLEFCVPESSWSPVLSFS